MSEAKHTPGPWAVILDSCFECEKKGEAEFIIDGPPGAYHGQFSHAPDAYLIAAAPDLLAACKLALPIFETRAIIDWSRLPADPDAMKASKAIHAAIAKAEGRT